MINTFGISSPSKYFSKNCLRKFLAAMKSSRSYDVTKCVSLCVRSHFVKFAAFKALEARCFEEVARVSQGCLLEVSRVFQGSFKDASRKF